MEVGGGGGYALTGACASGRIHIHTLNKQAHVCAIYRYAEFDTSVKAAVSSAIKERYSVSSLVSPWTTQRSQTL